jgi:DNA-binding MarR family transcriptional regulator
VCRLQAQGLVSRERYSADNRVVHVALTKAGRVMAERCRDASVKHERVLLGDISVHDQLLLKELLDRVYENARKGFAE